MSEKKKNISRRTALKTAAAAIVVPTIVPSSVFGQNAPSNMIRLGSIGTGRMGHGDMNAAINSGLSKSAFARFVAVCDLDANRRKHAKGEAEGRYRKALGEGKFEAIKMYEDFRELLARDDIDGVTISLPDHWHAIPAIAAANAGKAIYIQKPLTYSIVEGQKLVKAVRNNKVVLQTGSQQRSSQYFRLPCELVRNERIGKLHTIEVGIPTDKGFGKNTKMPVPKSLNYDMWLGPTPVEEYTEHRVHPQKGFGRPGWMQIERYCRGMITGWGAHMYDIAQWGMGTDFDSGPVEIMAKGEFPERGLFNVHVNYSGESMYANGVKLTSNNGRAGVKFIGDKGWIWCSRGGFNAHDRKIFKEKIGDDEIKLPVSKNHMLNFLESVRSGKDPICPVEVGHRSNSVCVLHHISMKLGGRKLKWDPVKEVVVGDAEANKLLDFPHRKPWTV